MKKILCVIATIGLMGCHPSASNMNSVSLGMTKQQVIERLGEPASTSAQGENEFLKYIMNEGGFFRTLNDEGRQEYFVKLSNNKVNAYGKKGDFDTTSLPAQKIIFEEHK